MLDFIINLADTLLLVNGFSILMIVLLIIEEPLNRYMRLISIRKYLKK